MHIRQDTKLESEGAEFLVLGLLLIEGISAYKTYINFRGYDLIAVNPETKSVARIQVKSRWATDYDNSFPLKNLECDFVVHVALNRGFRFRKKDNTSENAIKPPTFMFFQWQFFYNPVNVRDEAHIQHSVCFIEYKYFNRIKLNKTLIH